MDANWRRDAIVELLRQKGKVKARELAKRFHVTRQTICQDITVLSLRCDIYTERGQNGGIYLLEKKRPVRKSLSSSQIEVLEQLLPSLSEEKRLIVQSILHDFGSLRAACSTLIIEYSARRHVPRAGSVIREAP